MTTYNKVLEYDPQDREKRREDFMQQEWRCKPETGNCVLHYDGQWITLVHSKFGSGWGVYLNDVHCWKYNGAPINDLNAAKEVAFEMLENSAAGREAPCQS